MRTTRRYENLENNILNILNEEMTTTQLHKILLKITDYNQIHLRTILNRMRILEKQNKVVSKKIGPSILWKKK